MNARAAEGSLRLALRDATAQAHAQVDAFFPGGLRSQGDYRTYLRGMHGLLRALQDSLDRAGHAAQWNQAARIACLERDLAALRAVALAPGARIEAGELAQAAGALYVVEGSALGARVLMADARRLGYAETGASFLRSHGEGDAPQRWRHFVAWLEAQTFDAGQERSMFAAAAAAFACAKQEFQRAGAMEAD